MPTLTSTGNCNLTSSTNWSPALVPTTGDDLIVGAHTLTLDANITLNSLTFSATTSRLAYSGGPRTITVTGNVIFTAAISASLLTLTATQELIFIVGGFRTTANVVQYPFTVNGGTLRLYGTGSSSDSDLIDPTTANSFRLFQTSSSTSVVETRGRLSIGAGTHNLVLISGGSWTHTHTGTSNFNSVTGTAKFITVSGAVAATVVFNGNVSTTVPVSTTGLITMSGSNSTLDINGNIEATEALGAGALVNLTAGTLNLVGRIVHVAGTNSLTFLMSGGTFNHANQSITIPSNRTYTAYATAGVYNIGGLLVDNQNNWVAILSGTTTGTAAGAIITTVAGKSASINLLSPTYIFVEEGPATLPLESQVLSGVVYGYAGIEKTGTAVLITAENIRSAVGLSSANLDSQLGNLPTVSEFEARTLPAAEYFVVSDYTAPANGDIAAIKTKTDQLAFTVANQVDANALSGGGGGLDAAGVRAAIGLASANLDAQLADLPTVSEFNARSLPSADYFVVSDYTAPANLDIAAIKSKTDNLPSDPADQSILAAAIAAIPTTVDPDNRLLDVWRRLGLDVANPLVNTADTITAGSVLEISVTQTSTSVTTTRQP